MSRSEAELRRAKARAQERKECEELVRRYGVCPKWDSTKGIGKDIIDGFDEEDPPLHDFLLPIALIAADSLHLKVPRAAKRQKRWMVAWVLEHEEEIRQLLPRMALRDKSGHSRGLGGAALDAFLANPPPSFVAYLADTGRADA
jgi:hypothetical protein